MKRLVLNFASMAVIVAGGIGLGLASPNTVAATVPLDQCTAPASGAQCTGEVCCATANACFTTETMCVLVAILDAQQGGDEEGSGN